ncbi:MAG: 3-hydroxyacyl-CoA dehydrogenase family protein [Syntrophales bacterium]
MNEIRTITIVGAGTMGHSLAQTFAQAGYPVRLHDVDDEILRRAKSLVAANLRTFAEAGLLDAGSIATVVDRIRTTTSIAAACADADFVVEAVSEDAALKKELFRTLDAASPPRTILASNTSYLDIFRFVETARPDRVLITHWFAPPHIVPLVEIVRGPETSQDTVDRIRTLLAAMGKQPIVIAKFLPGFIANRLQSALTRETLFLLDNGYATAEEIDMVTKASFGLRIPILGTVKRMDFAGLDLTRKVIANAQYEPPATRRTSPAVDALVQSGRLGVKSGSGFYDYGGRSPEEVMKERDLKLLKLKKFLTEMGEL